MPEQGTPLEIMQRFEYVSPNEKSVEDIKKIRAACSTLADVLANTLKPSREKSLAITKLEEVTMWANKCVVFHQ